MFHFGFHAAQIFSDIGQCIFSSPKHKVLVSYWYQSLTAGNVFDLIKSRLYNNDIHLSFRPFVFPYINIINIAFKSRKMYVVSTSNFTHIGLSNEVVFGDLDLSPWLHNNMLSYYWFALGERIRAIITLLLTIVQLKVLKMFCFFLF